MPRNKWIIGILAFFIILLPNLGIAQSDKVKTAMADLKAETAKLGAPKLQGHDSLFRDHKGGQLNR
jgi:hypothetical protein